MSSVETHRLPSISDLGAQTMTPEELSELACHLRDLAGYLEEMRFLLLERRHRLLLEGIPNLPTIGYYLRLRATAPEESFEPPLAPPASRGRSEAPARCSSSGRLASSPRAPASASRSPEVPP